MNRWQQSGVYTLGLAVILACAVACSEPLRPPENLSMGKFPSGTFALLQWNNPNQRAISFELQWRFSDVPHWVPLASTPPGATTHPDSGPGHIAEWNFTGYCYRGRAVLGNSTSEWSDELCADMGAGEPHPPPYWPPPAREVSAESTDGGVRITWEAHDAGQFGLPDALVLRRESTEGAYDVIATLPYGTFDFTDDEGGRDHCYRIGTSFRDRGKSVSGDVCLR